MKTPKFWGLHAEPSWLLTLILSAVPFVVLVSAYLVTSHIRLNENPDDKFFPSIAKMVQVMHDKALVKDTRTGKYLLLADTVASVKRISIGVTAAAVCGLLIGLNLGLFSGLRATFLRFLTFVSIIPPLALLPILFVVFIALGIEEGTKWMIIFIGTCPTIINDIYLAAEKTHKEHKVKALTLGASQLGVVYRVILPQIIPKWLDSVGISLGSAWLFLLTAEFVDANVGLGYRIKTARQYSDMATIIPYVMVITLIGFLMHMTIKLVLKWGYPWYTPKK